MKLGFLACPLNIGTAGHPVKYGIPDTCGEIAKTRFIHDSIHGTSKPFARLPRAANSVTAADLLPGSGGAFIHTTGRK